MCLRRSGVKYIYEYDAVCTESMGRKGVCDVGKGSAGNLMRQGQNQLLFTLSFFGGNFMLLVLCFFTFSCA